jgi:hypothetical protein
MLGDDGFDAARARWRAYCAERERRANEEDTRESFYKAPPQLGKTALLGSVLCAYETSSVQNK